MTRDEQIELLARALVKETEAEWADRLAHCASCREDAQYYRQQATALLDQIAPLLTAQVVAEERAACTGELRLAVAAARAEERERCAKVAEHYRDMCGECHWPEEAVIAGGNVANDIAADIRKQEGQG